MRHEDPVFCLPLLAPGRIKSPRMLDEHISRAFEALSGAERQLRQSELTLLLPMRAGFSVFEISAHSGYDEVSKEPT